MDDLYNLRKRTSASAEHDRPGEEAGRPRAQTIAGTRPRVRNGLYELRRIDAIVPRANSVTIPSGNRGEATGGTDSPRRISADVIPHKPSDAKKIENCVKVPREAWAKLRHGTRVIIYAKDGKIKELALRRPMYVVRVFTKDGVKRLLLENMSGGRGHKKYFCYSMKLDNIMGLYREVDEDTEYILRETKRLARRVEELEYKYEGKKPASGLAEPNIFISPKVTPPPPVVVTRSKSK